VDAFWLSCLCDTGLKQAVGTAIIVGKTSQALPGERKFNCKLDFNGLSGCSWKTICLVRQDIVIELRLAAIDLRYTGDLV
jgi:hypothetical protein